MSLNIKQVLKLHVDPNTGIVIRAIALVVHTKPRAGIPKIVERVENTVDCTCIPTPIDPYPLLVCV